MKTLNRIISLLMVALMLTAAVPFTPVSAADDGTESYTLTVENTYTDSSLAESSNFGGMSFFGSTEFDGCYGNQLSGVAREIYDSLVKKYVTDKKTGEYTHTFETSFTFDAEISGGSIVMNDKLEEIDIEIGYAVQAAMDAFLYDNPEVFWLKKLSTSYGVSASGNSVDGFTGSIEDITIIPEEIYAGASSKISQYDIAVDSALDSITVTESRYDTLKNIHDYICNNAWYNLVNEQRVHSSEPFFIGDGGVVCEGYAKAFKVLCDRMAIPCVLVSGDAGGAHMWNYVQMDDGKWYLIDATWDDQESKIYDTYFLANTNTVGFNDVAISEERTERNDFSGTGVFSFTYPVLSATAYTVHVHEWESDYTVDLEPTCTEKGSKSIHCKTCEATKSVTEIPADHADENLDKLCDICGKELPVESGCCGVKVWNEELNDEVFGDSVKYYLYADGTLELYGTGEVATRAFYENDKVKNLIVRDGITKIGSESFDECDYLESIILSASIVKIDEAAFYHCDELVDISFSNGLRFIESCAFQNCRNIENIILPDSLNTIGSYAFCGCDDLETIRIPESVSTIGESAFSGCVNLTELKIPEAIESISDYLLHGCSGLTEFEIPDNVTSIGDSSFAWCTGLTFIAIPESVKTIDDYAFSGCSGLKCIMLPKGTNKIDDNAFEYCNELNEILYGGTENTWLDIFIGDNNDVLNESNIYYSHYCPHIYSSDYTVDKKATCSAEGSKSKHCTVNDCTAKIDVTVIPPAGHKDSDYNAECDVCFGSVNDIEIGENIITIKKNDDIYLSFTATKDGRYTLSSEDMYISIDVYNEDKSEHEHDIDESSSMCTLKAGQKVYWRIKNALLKERKIIVKLNRTEPHIHDFSSITVIKDDDCTAAGIRIASCSCGATSTTVIPATEHKPVIDKAITSTCSKTGLTEGSHCSVCKAVIKKQNVVAKKAHTYKTTITKATLSKNGKSETKCTACGYVSKTTVIYAPKTLKLSVTSYTYDGKTKTPSVTVKDSKGKKLKNGTDYTVKYSKGRKSIGKYTVTVTFKGNYSGTKKLTFEIVPAKVTLSKLTAGSKALTAKWKTVSGATGYEVQYSTSKKFTSKTTKTVKIKSSKTKKTTIKKLTKGKKYYVRIRAYKTVNKKPVYGSWSSVKSIKVK